MDALISNFFYDVICRLIPGIVVIWLYGGEIFIRASTMLRGSSISLTVFIMLIAWVIGVTLDTITFAPFYYFPKIRQAFFPTEQQREMDAQFTKMLSGKEETDAQNFLRLQLVRLQAEIVLFRVMMFISAFAIVLPPTILSDDKMISHLYGVIGTFVFFICWWFGRNLIKKP
jgi:hypothetical protein